MNKVSQVKSSIRKERWLSIIKECRSGGMTIRAWCKQNNIKEATCYRNLQKLRSEICEQLLVAVYPGMTKDKMDCMVDAIKEFCAGVSA